MVLPPYLVLVSPKGTPEVAPKGILRCSLVVMPLVVRWGCQSGWSIRSGLGRPTVCSDCKGSVRGGGLGGEYTGAAGPAGVRVLLGSGSVRFGFC